jgi:hypothetical protein
MNWSEYLALTDAVCIEFCVFICGVLDCIKWNGMIIGKQWIGKAMEGSSHGLIMALFGHLLGGIEGNHDKPVRIVSVLAKIWTEHHRTQVRKVPTWNILFSISAQIKILQITNIFIKQDSGIFVMVWIQEFSILWKMKQTDFRVWRFGNIQ